MQNEKLKMLQIFMFTLTLNGSAVNDITDFVITEALIILYVLLCILYADNDNKYPSVTLRNMQIVTFIFTAKNMGAATVLGRLCCHDNYKLYLECHRFGKFFSVIWTKISSCTKEIQYGISMISQCQQL